MKSELFSFPVGYYLFHNKQLYNFKLNRWHSFGYLLYDDLKEAGKKKKFSDWKLVMTDCAQKKEKENKAVEKIIDETEDLVLSAYGDDLITASQKDKFLSSLKFQRVQKRKRQNMEAVKETINIETF